MKKNVIMQLLSSTVLFAFLSLPLTTNAQGTKANFAGTWAFNESKSNLGDGGGFRRGAGQMTVTQDGINLTVVRVRTNQNGEQTTTTDKYTTDGKECVNTSTTGRGGPSKSILKWSADGKSLNFAITRTFERDGKTTEMKSSEVWTLTDAKTLSVASTFSSPNGEMKSTLVYDKK